MPATPTSIDSAARHQDMPEQAIRVLFVAHDAYRAGATIFLLNMLRWMRENTTISFDVALRDQGEMVSEFEKLCPSYVLHPPGGRTSSRFRLRRWLSDRLKRNDQIRHTLESLVRRGNYDLVYLNTITLGDQLATLSSISIPFVTHVHELSSAIRRYGRGQEQLVISRSARLICVSDAVADNLNVEHGCPVSKIERIYGFVPLVEQLEHSSNDRREALLGPLKIPSNALIVGLCGHGDIRKGADLLVPLVRLMPRVLAGRQIHFVWVGVQAPEYPHDVALRDARLAEVADRIHYPGVTKTPADWISLFDIHLLLSREDPFPLVVMESAGHAVPTVAFDSAGGAAEFIQSDAGLCTPYLDLPALAEALTSLLEDESRRRAMGLAARARVQQRHSPGVVLPKVVQTIKHVALSANTSAFKHRPK